MAVPKGTRIGGRAKGTVNKDTQTLQELAQKHKCDPYEILILYAKRDHKALGLPEYVTVAVTESGEPIERLTISPELQQKSARDACKYLHPERRAVEVSASPETIESYEQIIKKLDQQK